MTTKSNRRAADAEVPAPRVWLLPPTRAAAKEFEALLASGGGDGDDAVDGYSASLTPSVHFHRVDAARGTLDCFKVPPVGCGGRSHQSMSLRPDMSHKDWVSQERITVKRLMPLARLLQGRAARCTAERSAGRRPRARPLRRGAARGGRVPDGGRADRRGRLRHATRDGERTGADSRRRLASAQVPRSAWGI